MPRPEMDPRDSNLGPDGLPSIMPSDYPTPLCDDCSEEQVWVKGREGMAYCPRCDSYTTVVEQTQTAYDAWRDFVMETPFAENE